MRRKPHRPKEMRLDAFTALLLLSSASPDRFTPSSSTASPFSKQDHFAPHLYRSRTLRMARGLRFGRLGGLRQDRGSCLPVYCT